MECEARGKWVRNRVEVRSTDRGISIEGYAAVFGQVAEIAGYFREVIAAGAFTEAIPRDDVPLLVNHQGLPLARSRAGTGTLELSQDDHGLKIRADLAGDDPDVKAIVGKMQRGDLDKMSFAFLPDVEEWDETGDLPLRTVKRAQLFDVSIVTSPAYDGTAIGLRSLARYRESAVRQDNFAAARRRLRMRLELDLKVRG